MLETVPTLDCRHARIVPGPPLRQVRNHVRRFAQVYVEPPFDVSIRAPEIQPQCFVLNRDGTRCHCYRFAFRALFALIGRMVNPPPFSFTTRAPLMRAEGFTFFSNVFTAPTMPRLRAVVRAFARRFVFVIY